MDSPPESSPIATPWLRLGCVLPRRLRERVFEPAYFDLLSDHVRRPRRTMLGLRVALLLLETGRVAWPDAILHAWRVRGVRVAVTVTACALAALVFLAQLYQYQ